jgi:hypothetical protein
MNAIERKQPWTLQEVRHLHDLPLTDLIQRA